MSLAVIWPILLGIFIGWGCVAAHGLRSRRARAALPPREAVNMFDGTVFPAPHDARWRLADHRRPDDRRLGGGDTFVFGDSDISLSDKTLVVDGETISSTDQVGAYHSNVQRCYYDFRRTLALQSAESSVLNAQFGDAEARWEEASRKLLPASPVGATQAEIVPRSDRRKFFRPIDPPRELPSGEPFFVTGLKLPSPYGPWSLTNEGVGGNEHVWGCAFNDVIDLYVSRDEIWQVRHADDDEVQLANGIEVTAYWDLIRRFHGQYASRHLSRG